ncbi:MAG: putative cation efflux protein [Chthonomonadales bacterium]|nr:putative cation efflux protein [Chthonomonadales bacterium]
MTVDMPRNLPERRSKVALKWAADSQDVRTVWIALVCNIVVAIAKIVAGLWTGSAAMLAEAAHSFADSINEVLLGISLQRSKKPADTDHPFGYGREQFLWAFLAAIASFLIGGCLSVGLAIRELSRHTTPHNQIASWIVLGIAFLADGVSWVQSFRQLREDAGKLKVSVWKYLRDTSDPVVRAIVVEDSAALVGIVLAAGGLLASRMSGKSTPDAIASLLIGVLLAGTATGLALTLAGFLIGRSLPHKALGEIQKLMEASPAIASVVGVSAVYVGPGEAIVVAKITPASTTVEEFAAGMDALDHRIREAIPLVADVFVDVTAQRPDNSPP